MDETSGSNVVDVGVDLSEFYMSVEWDILDVPAVRLQSSPANCVVQIMFLTYFRLAEMKNSTHAAMSHTWT